MLKDFIPPILFKAKRALFPAGSPDHGWFGDYASWQDAVAATSGYDQDQILSRILDATRKVESGQAAYERDGVLFDRVQHNWPLLASLVWVAAREAGELRVCDFGGFLGTVYRQSRSFLGHLGHLRSGVVEQPHFVAAGKAEFETQALSFYETLADCSNAIAPTTLLLSSVLQYLPEPYAFLDQAVSLGFPYLVLDRTALIDAPEDQIGRASCRERV
jgi:putative methyltransferase (TIGR04325 family)